MAIFIFRVGEIINMLIRMGTIDEMLTLWNEPISTSNFFVENIKNKNTEFWTIEEDKRLIGELYLFKKLKDTDLANGNTIAYLCAFRIIEELQGRGYGTSLINRVFKRLQDLKFESVTIGVEECNEANIRLYKRLGFVSELKRSCLDPCNVNEKYEPLPCSEIIFLKKSLL